MSNTENVFKVVTCHSLENAKITAFQLFWYFSTIIYLKANLTIGPNLDFTTEQPQQIMRKLTIWLKIL